ncbi:MAG TPA: hypothetical protein VGV89_10530 [Thermoplasmata archaeon]|nr:hypothetical protein [Thermoplasmata archaeon]
MPARTTEPNARDEAEQLVRDVARDSVQAARIGWRIAARVGEASLRWAERATDQLLEEVDKHRPGKRGGSG